ncbi:MAG: carbohydrate kinase family protein [Chloroflexi bacterium]|nr:carbohydrate kinase family protein [Chloroflexota bacterium]
MTLKSDGTCVFLGGSSVDIILEMPHIPLPDEKVLAEFSGIQAGGLVANTACAAARLGLKTAWAGVVGDDEAGSLVLSEFERFGVDASHTRVLPGARSDFCVIMLDPSRERTILVVETTNNMPDLDQALLDMLAKARMVYLTPHNPQIFAVIEAAVHRGAGQLAIDVEAGLALPPDEIDFCLSHSDIIFTNRSAVQRISGEEHLEAGARKWLAKGASLVVATLGAAGAAVFSQAKTCFQPGYIVPVVDTTGAGDAFHAAFLFGILSGWTLDETLVFSNAAAALSVRKLGARPGQPTYEDVNVFLATKPLLITHDVTGDF